MARNAENRGISAPQEYPKKRKRAFRAGIGAGLGVAVGGFGLLISSSSGLSSYEAAINDVARLSEEHPSERGDQAVALLIEERDNFKTTQEYRDSERMDHIALGMLAGGSLLAAGAAYLGAANESRFNEKQIESERSKSEKEWKPWMNGPQ